MKRSLIIILIIPFVAIAHPGIGIVKDSRGNIFYSDLKQVWKIQHGLKTIAVPGVHTHELYIDGKDNLYGQHEYNTTDITFYHYLWVLRPNGKLDTIIDATLAYQQIDFSLARDRKGNEYYTRQFLKRKDTAHIYIKTPYGKERIFAKGNFKGVPWLHPQEDGSILFVQHNNVYRALPTGQVRRIAQNIASSQPSFSFSGNSPTVWGIWQDVKGNIYVAVFSDQVVKKITPNGEISNYYHSTGYWAPTHGVFDNKGQLRLMESSDKNEIRVIQSTPLSEQTASTSTTVFYLGLSGLFVALAALYFRKAAHR